jgi:hypothetical protein
VNHSTKELVHPELHGHVWFTLVQNDSFNSIVECLLEEFYEIAHDLAQVQDSISRSAINIASQKNQQTLKEALYFYKRFELLNNGSPVHQSTTSVVYIALDHMASAEETSIYRKC